MRYKVIYDLYCIFDDGRVYSYKSFKWLRPDIDKNGYYKITLHYENSRYRFSLHRLVAKYFIPNPFNLPQINHIDGNKGNNHWSNLEWCSALYNNKHARILGLNNISESNRKRWENPEFRNKTSAKFRDVFKDRNFKSRNNPNFRYSFIFNDTSFTIAELTKELNISESKAFREAKKFRNNEPNLFSEFGIILE